MCKQTIICLGRPHIRIGTFCSQHVRLITKWRPAADSVYNHARPVKLLSLLYSVYLMKYAGKHVFGAKWAFLGTSFLRRPFPCTKRPQLFLHYHMKAQNAHLETKQPYESYRDMDGRFGNTCHVHAKSEGGVRGKIWVGFLGTWENITLADHAGLYECATCQSM